MEMTKAAPVFLMRLSFIIVSDYNFIYLRQAEQIVCLLSLLVRSLGHLLMKTILVAVGTGILLSPFSRSAQLEVDVGRSRIQVDAKATGHGFTGSLQKYEAKIAGDAATG